MSSENANRAWGDVLREAHLAAGYGMREFAELIAMKPSRFAEIRRTGIATQEEVVGLAAALREIREKKILRMQGDQSMESVPISRSVQVRVATILHERGFKGYEDLEAILAKIETGN